MLHNAYIKLFFYKNINIEEAIQLAYGMSVVLLRCPFVPEILNGRASEVFFHQ
jgi:hypothetical protein